ncbi:MAG: DUF445 domain-containing protein [Microthrixaceae bacterium]|jgi:uncharacterized membrane-anchored protein YjiN (DUF445 family)|nr:DUF445 domain-containing protein [Microthrixaceae bacterium]
MATTFDLNEDELTRVGEIRSMKRTASLVLAAATAAFVVARIIERAHPAWGYVRATAEAAMVGGIADWFAVTALFRHPLGIPIPHTAILPNRKDQLGRTMGSFVQRSFLAPDLVAERLAEADIATRLGEWLDDEANVTTVARQAGSLAATVARLLDDDEVAELVSSEVFARLREVDPAPIAARVLEVATEDGRHHQLIDAALTGALDMMATQRPMLRSRFAAESPWWVPESIDERVFERLFAALGTFFGEIRSDPSHPLRHHVDARLRDLIEALRTDPERAARVGELRDELLDHPSVREWSRQIWVELRERVIAESSAPGSALQSRLEQAVRSLRHALANDPDLGARVEAAAVDVARTVCERYGDEIASFVETTVQRWDATETSLRVELLLGRDLQIIRINGSVVGGLAGLVIYGLGQLLG